MEIPRESGKDYVPGDVIVKFEAQVHCITDECKSKFCDNCREKSDELKKCSKCLQMFYCGKDCQQNDWKAHKYECKVFRDPRWNLNPLITPKRLLLRWWLCYEKDPEFSKRKYPTLDGQMFCFDDIKLDLDAIKQDIFKMSQIHEIVSEYELYGLKINRDHFLKLFALKSKTVTFEFPHYDNNVRKSISMLNSVNCGMAIIFQLSQHNHSCLPNASKLFKGFTMELRAMKPIAKGENITLGFIDLANDKLTRQMQMLVHSIPDYSCNKCLLNLDKALDYEKFKALRASHMQFWLTLDNAMKLPSNKQYKIDWEFFDKAKIIYGEYHPVITQFLILSYVYFAENSRYATKPVLKVTYEKIEPHLMVTHGSDHPYYQNFKKFASKYISF